jgi:Tol biopolymer transport system component
MKSLMSPQQSIAHYRFISKLGEGGMGAVYRATDTRLNRDVAIKVLPDSFAKDPDRLARFAREAQVLASLNHPNIATIHGVEERAIVMELVEGQAPVGPMTAEQALPLIQQLIDALEYSHERGVVHRDLKPANIKITSEGRLKVLDFGLAKAMSGDPVTTGSPVDSPTLTMRATMKGVILGTAAYMSPEQARGQTTDQRTDIWAFGVCVWELLTGRSMFESPSVSDTLAAVLTRDPEWDAVPARFRKLLRLCLMRDPRQRLRHIGDARLFLDEPQVATVARAQRPWGWIAAAVVAAVAATALWTQRRDPPAPERAYSFELVSPPGTHLVATNGGGAISPDGRTIAMVASSGGAPKLWLRPLDSTLARDLTGTEGAQYPFWSPDSRSIGFFAAGKLKRIDLIEGRIAVLADAVVARGGAWREDGAIIFGATNSSGLFRVPAGGGTAATAFTSLEAKTESGHRWPAFLPGGKRFLYTAMSSGSRSGIYIASFEHPENRKLLFENRGGAIYVPPRLQYPGYVLWLRQGTLTAQAFNPEREELSGEPMAVPGGEMVSLVMGANTYSGLSVSNDGIILGNRGSPANQPVWKSRDGRALSSVLGVDHYAGVQISPDGTRAVLAIGDPSTARDISIVDFARGVKTRLTSGGIGLSAFWSRDGRSVVYYVTNGGAISEQDASGARPAQVLVDTKTSQGDDVSPDGRVLLFDEVEPDGFKTLLTLPMLSTGRGDQKPSVYLKTRSRQSPQAQFSTDGKWVAYSSDESGEPEIYVQSYPTPETKKIQVSTHGGNLPRWRKDEMELFYRATDGTLMAAPVHVSGTSMTFGSPAALFRIDNDFGARFYPCDVSADGQRFLVLAQDNADKPPLTILINWQAGLKK